MELGEVEINHYQFKKWLTFILGAVGAAVTAHMVCYKKL
jgi:hypothetical protein